jgi:Bacterial Ig domain/Polysaccharide deacetylase
MRKMLFLLVVGLAAIAASPAGAAIEVVITSPASSAHVGDVGAVVPVQITASATSGVYGVQLNVDGQPYPDAATWDSTPTGQYLYEIDWNMIGLAAGTHLLSVTAMDWSVAFPEGATQESDPITVDVGPAYPTISLSSPAPFTFVHGSSVPVGASFTSASNPATVQLSADGTALSATVGSGTATATWDSTSVSDGSHPIGASVVDARGKSASASATVTVDNTPPSTFIAVPAANGFFTGSLAATAHASDAHGIASVQFAIDGVSAGGVRTSPDGGSGFNYSSTLSLASLASGAHQLTAVATDMAGNISTTAAVSFSIGVTPPTVSIATPPTNTYAHGTVTVGANVTGGSLPDSVQLYVDGVASGAPDTSSPYSFAWNTTGVADGSHTLMVRVTDAQSRTASSAVVNQTVDNTAPSTFVTAPAAGSFFQGSLPATAHASDAFGVKSVQFAIDGTLVGSPITAPDGGSGFNYSATLSLTGLANGAHALTSVVTDNAGNTSTSAAVSFTIGSGPATVVVTVPPDWMFASKTIPVTATVTGGSPPFAATLLVDGVATAVVPTVSGNAYTFAWNTITLADGTHTIQVSVKDATNLTSSSAVLHETVDNTLPTAVMYQPTAANSRNNGPTTFQVHASDAFGVKSVQFTADGIPVGALLTAPDPGQSYLYTITFDTSTLTAGSHGISAAVTDNAGNVVSAPPVTITTGTISYIPVLNYHEINPPGGYSIYDETPAEADAQLSYLKTNGYQSVTLEQYQQWLGGANIGVAKPVLITVDDGIKDEQAWDPILQKYGFTAVMFVVTGFADNLTPGDSDPNNMTWANIQALVATGRWQAAFHAGQYGHGDSYADVPPATINLGGGVTLSFPSTCPYFYSCLGTRATTTGTGANRKTTTAIETPAQAETRITNEVNAGMTEIKTKVPTASMVGWAGPFNDEGQWTNLYNDGSGTLQSWLPGFMASKFPIIFTQTDPVTYAQASGTVGALNGFNRRYRFEVHTDTTITQFGAALTDLGFAR